MLNTLHAGDVRMLDTLRLSMLKLGPMKTKDAIDAFGSASALARELCITRAAISQWGDQVPELRAYQIRDLLAQREAAQAAESSDLAEQATHA